MWLDPFTARLRFAPILAVALIVVLMLGGCGDDQDEQEVRQAARQLEAEKRKERFDALLKARAKELRRQRSGNPLPPVPAKFKGDLAVRYKADRWICSAVPPSEAAEGLKLDADSDLETIARAHSETWPEEYRQASYEGCLAGLEKAERDEEG
ncbi:MAG TPA: hypothetical protein VFZ41_06405 [Solirubrobacterales bacterium]